MNGDKIKNILNDHKEITIDEIKKIPRILDNPVLVLKSKTGNSRLVMFGSVKAKNGKPMLVVLDLRPRENGFLLNDMQKVNSTYTKTETYDKTAEDNGMKFVQSSEVLYLDKKRTTHLLSAIGFYMPITCNQSGYIGNISYAGGRVKLEGKPFSEVIADKSNSDTQNEDIRYSDREIVGESGKNYGVGVYLDSNLLTGLTDSERKEMVKEFVVSELEGKHFVAYDRNNNAVDIGIAKKSDTMKNKNGKKRSVLKELYNKYNDFVVKQEAIVLIDELIANATYDSPKTPTYPHEWLDNYGKNDWDYWKVYVQEKNKTVWEAILNIANTTNGEKILYDINPIKMVEEAIKSASTTTTDSIFQDDTKSQQQFQDRETTTLYEVMGENKTLKKQNQKLSEDVERLRERLKLEKQVTNGNTFNKKQLDVVAGHIRKLANSNYDKVQLANELNEVYSYIVQTPDLIWDNLMAKCYEVAGNVLKEQRGVKVTDNYFKDVLTDIRKTRISLTQEQIQEAKNIFGEKYRNAFMGRIMITNDGISLDQKWQEWSSQYPEIFSSDITGGDQITALSDIYDYLRDGATSYQMFNDIDTTRSLATEIYNQYWNVSTIRTTADKYDKQIKRLNFEHRKTMSELRTEYKDRLQKQKAADRAHYGEIIKNIRQRNETELQQAREFGRRRVNEYKDRIERNAKIKSITNKALTLNKWLTKNSKDSHIAEPMKQPVSYLLNAIDFSSKQLLGMNGGDKAFTETRKDISLSKALEQVHNMVQDISKSQVSEKDIESIYGGFVDFPPGFDDDVKELSSKANDIMRSVGDNSYVLNQMSLEELQTLDEIVSTIKSIVTQMNKFLAVRHAEGIAHLSKMDIEYLDSLGKGKVESKLKKLLNWSNTTPYYAFRRFGQGGQKVYEALMDGWDKFSFHVKDIIDFTESAYKSKEVKEWENEIKTFRVLKPATDEILESPDYEPIYQSVQMTVPQIMSMYCLSKRKKGMDHLLGGGMTVSDIETKKGIKKDVITQPEGVVLTNESIQEIISSLTDRQRKVADKLQEFMNTTCKDWGNEVSMLRFGYKSMEEDNYFPIQSDPTNLPAKDVADKENSLFRLLNMSFTKSTDDKANNRIIVSDIFDVFAQHSSDMAKYNALALPVLDAFKWYNYKEKTKSGDTQHDTKTIKQSLKYAFGENAQNYIITFLKDINGAQNTSRDTVGNFFFKNAKIASVAANLRVACLQPTSYLRASAVIDVKYLSKAFLSKPKISNAEEYCGIALWKSLGFYDTNIQRGVTSLIKHDETWKDKTVERTMKLAELGDKITWGYLWNACELEVREKRKDLEVKSVEFYTAISKRLREVIYATQVVDSTMTRSQLMRSGDGYDKMLTAFASEPTLSYSMMQDASWQYKLAKRRGEGKSEMIKHRNHFLRVAMAYTVTNVMCALVESGFDAFRDDDDDDEANFEEFLKLYLKNFLNDMSFTGKVPYIKEMSTLLQGFSTSRTDTQWMQSFAYAGKGFLKLIQGKGNAYSTYKHMMRAFSYVSGLPFYNAWRDLMSGLNKFNVLTAEELEEAFNELLEIE